MLEETETAKYKSVTTDPISPIVIHVNAMSGMKKRRISKQKQATCQFPSLNI